MIQTAQHVTANEAWHLSGLKQWQAAQGHTFTYKVKQHKLIWETSTKYAKLPETMVYILTAGENEISWILKNKIEINKGDVEWRDGFEFNSQVKAHKEKHRGRNEYIYFPS